MGAPRSMTTLSVKGREKQSQCGMRVAWAPLDPAETNRRAKSPRGCVTFAACDGESAKKQHDEHDSKDEQTRTTIRSPLAGIHIVEFWKPGEDFNLLGSLHLLASKCRPEFRAQPARTCNLLGCIAAPCRGACVSSWHKRLLH